MLASFAKVYKAGIIGPVSLCTGGSAAACVSEAVFLFVPLTKAGGSRSATRAGRALLLEEAAPGTGSAGSGPTQLDVIAAVAS